MPPGSYKNAPIEEALCEFRFAAGPEWNLTIPGRLHAKVSQRYSGAPRQQNVLNANVAVPDGGAPSVAMNQSFARIQFPTADGTKMLSVGHDMLAVHTLRPYDGWNQFKPRIVEALAAYTDVAEPTGLLRLGVRYINRIELPSDDFDQFFVAAPHKIDGFPQTMTGFFHRTEYLYENQVKALVTFATMETNRILLLDIDLISEAETSMDEVPALVDHLHAREGELFERLIKEPLRERFDA